MSCACGFCIECTGLADRINVEIIAEVLAKCRCADPSAPCDLHDPAERIATLWGELRRTERRVEALEAALKPFSDIVDTLDRTMPTADRRSTSALEEICRRARWVLRGQRREK